MLKVGREATCSCGLKLSFLSFETSDANTASGAAVESTHDALIEMMKCPATCEASGIRRRARISVEKKSCKDLCRKENVQGSP